LTGATNSFIWVYSNGNYSCHAIDANGCNAVSNQLRVTIVCFPPLPAIDKTQQEEIVVPDAEVFPNPALEEFNIRFNQEIELPVLIKIYDLTGRIVFESVERSHSRVISLPGQPAGFYSIEISNDSGIKIQKRFIAL
jgi:hypothetical protein